MKIGASKVQKIAKNQRLLNVKMTSNGGNANFLLFMDTHSDYATGWVAHAMVKSDGTQLVGPAPQVNDPVRMFYQSFEGLMLDSLRSLNLTWAAHF